MRSLLCLLIATCLVGVVHAATQEIPPVRADEVQGLGFDRPFVDIMPELIYRVPPTYPPIAREAGVDGTVKVQLLVDTNGVVSDARVTNSIPMLDAAARMRAPVAIQARVLGRSPGHCLSARLCSST
jgi:hypothetical protein